MAELVFFTGTMDSGKSTLALQMDYNHRAGGRLGLLFTRHDRSGEAAITSRLGLRTPAIEVTSSSSFWDEVVRRRTHGEEVDYLICDEAQFYRAEQVDDLARVVDELEVDVYAFGIGTDFRARLFEGSQRLVELADRIESLQVPTLCWCGRRATHNARTVGGTMVRTGEQVVVADITGRGTLPPAGVMAQGQPVEVGYETLCRRHYMAGRTAATADVMGEGEQLLPFGE
ncbi:thymidine kinase [Sinomonas sp. ASV486]|uniref:thymidine kinase n=1 Tax=Sinomonas sp. ASV486 TaxID=3051170 RepID=UPI0027DCF968|nr:thymidine kinase [Sinomonas sp. ASV486]MDQ4489691.1 thymidine kinase [Sinomonas sp. ASV486]